MAAKIIHKSTKVLVTGSTGFIGKHLMKLLGPDGIHYDIRKHKFMDINNLDNLRSVIIARKPSVIVHLAAVSNAKAVDRNPSLALETNIMGTYNVLRLAKQYGIRVILASSAATKEPDLSLYGTTKECMEDLAGLFDNVVIARFYNVYGPGSKSVVNKFVKAINNRWLVVLNGNTVRDYIHVDDIVLSLLQLIEASDPPRVVELGTGRAVSLRKLIGIISRITGKKASVINGDPIHEIQYSQCLKRYGSYQVTLDHGIRGLL